MPVEVVIMSRAECHLCDEAKKTIETAVRQYALDVDLRVVDIDADQGLQLLYGTEVPVVFVRGRKVFKYRVDAERFARQVRVAARD